MEVYAGDKCTVVSIVPFPILLEEKPGMYPGRFHIPAAVGAPQVLVVGKSKSEVPLPGERPPLVVETPPAEVARSIVDDYVESQLAADQSARPGISWLPGEWSVEDVVRKQPQLLADLLERQRKWFVRLVEMADTDWTRYRSHRVIADFQRYACTALGLEREWNVEVKPEVLLPTKCPACGSQVAEGVAVCSVCRCVLDKERYSELKFA